MMEEGNPACEIQRQLNITTGGAAEKISFKILPGSGWSPDISLTH